MQKIFSCSSDKIESKIQPLLDSGWMVKHMVSEVVAIAMASGTRPYEGKDTESIRGNIIVVLEK